MRPTARLAGRFQRSAAALVIAAIPAALDASAAHDRLGDPLPHGALQRLGTARMRGGIGDLCYLPDGRGVLAAAGRVEIWDLARGTLQARHQVCKSTIVSVQARRDGGALLLAETSGTVHEWDVERGKVLHSWPTKQAGLCRARYSPDERRVLTTGSRPPTLKEWDLATGRQRIAVTGRMHFFREAIYGPAGKTAVVDGSNGSGPLLAHYDLSDGRVLKEWLADYYTHARSLALSADGKRLLVGSRHKATEWLLDGYKPLKTYTGHHGHAVVSIAYGKDPNRILTGSRDGSIRCWNRTEGKVLLRWFPHSRYVTHMAVSPDGRWVLSYGDALVAETSLATGEPRVKWDRHSEAVRGAAFLPDGRRVVSASGDGTLRVWNARDGTCLRTIAGARTGAYALAVSPDGSRLAAGCKDGIVREFDPNDGAALGELKGHRGYVRSLAYTPDGSRLLSAAGDGSIRVWARGGAGPVAVLQGHRGGVMAVAVSGDGRRALSGGRDGTVRLWDLGKASLLKTMQGHRSWVRAVAFCAAGKGALSTGDDSRLLRWDLNTGGLAAEMAVRGAGGALVCNAAGTRAYAAGENCGVACWDLASGKLLEERKGHARSVRALALSPDEKTIVTASDDTTLLVWQVPGRK